MSPVSPNLWDAYSRYGPGRLPGADRRDIGGGYAFATAILGFAFVYILDLIGIVPWTADAPVVFETLISYFLLVAGLLGCGFLGGFLTWRYLPGHVPYFGVVAGFLASVLTHFFVGYIALLIVIVGVEYYSLLDKVIGLVISPVGFYLIARDYPVTLAVLYLIGMTGGHIYEEIREAPDT